MAGKDILTMTQAELKRLHVVKQILAKKLKQTEAAELLYLGQRQIRRIVARVRKEQDKGVIHKSRGQPSNRRLPEQLKNKVIRLYKTKYKGFGPVFACEKLFEIDKIKLSDETLRIWLIKNGLWERKRKRKKYRCWRQRKHHFGEMVQMDGSHHDWFEGRGPWCVLMGYIDDATSNRFARFYEYEGVMPAFDSLKRYIKRYGIPKSLYLDKHTTYKSNGKPTIEDQLNNKRYLSQVERAAEDLGIEIIHANSPQAKGRVERSFKTYQDRLVKEMRLRGIKSIEEANKFLGEFLPGHSRKFSVKPLKEADLHQPVPQNIDLNNVLCVRIERSLRNDFTLVHNKKLYQVSDKTVAKKVIVEERINGTMYVTYKGEKLKFKQLYQKPQRQAGAKPKPKLKQIYRPSLDHPFKGAMFERRLAHLQAKGNSKKLALANV